MSLDDVARLCDEIDDLVDASLSGGAFAHDPDPYPRCPHCGRDWHYLALTQRIEGMYEVGEYDESYVFDADDSPIICPGSEFIGPLTEDQWDQVHPRLVWVESVATIAAALSVSRATVYPVLAEQTNEGR